MGDGVVSPLLYRQTQVSQRQAVPVDVLRLIIDFPCLVKMTAAIKTPAKWEVRAVIWGCFVKHYSTAANY